MIKVNLFRVDISEAQKWANLRVIERTLAGKLDPKKRDDNYKRHRTGCLGEWAVCKHYQCEWTGMYYEGKSWENRAWDTEVGEVRATFYPDFDNGMRINPSDKYPAAPFIWVILSKRGNAIVQATLVGWFYKEDAKKPEWWSEEKGYWVVPRAELRPIEELPTVSQKNEE